MQQLFYGGFPFQPDTVSFRIVKRPIIGRLGRRNFVDHVWFIDGRVYGANTTEVQAQMLALENALVDGGDLIFSLYHRLISSDCVNGTKILKFEWLKGYDGVRGSGAELVLRRTFQLQIGGRILATSDTDLIEYHESVQGVGSTGPIIIPVTSLAGDVQAQQTVLKTPWWGIQSGYAIGLTATPPVATAIWWETPGVYYDPLSISEAIETPINWGVNQNTGWKISWRYKCWSRNVLVTSPIPPF